MDCLTFLDRLAALLDGTATPSEQASAETHALRCAECGDLLRAARGGQQAGGSAPGSRSPQNATPLRESSPGPDGPAPEDLVGPVLARTTGPACQRAEDLLCDFVDSALDPGSASVLEAHLRHCPSCCSLAETLRGMNVVLASLAELEPGPRLLPAVLEATSHRRRGGWLAERVAAWSEVLLARPRLSLEAAYAGTLLILLVFGNPAATVQAASERTATLAQAGIGRVRTALPDALSSLSVREKEMSDVTVRIESLGQKLSAPRRTVEQAAGGWWESVSARWERAWRFARGAFDWVVAQLDANASSIREAVKDLFSGRTEPDRPAAR